MGEVYRGRDTRLDRSVELKILAPTLAPDADFRARFTREARAVSALNHPHICSLYDVGREHDVDRDPSREPSGRPAGVVREFPGLAGTECGGRRNGGDAPSQPDRIGGAAGGASRRRPLPTGTNAEAAIQAPLRRRKGERRRACAA